MRFTRSDNIDVVELLKIKILLYQQHVSTMATQLYPLAKYLFRKWISRHTRIVSPANCKQEVTGEMKKN